MQRSPWRLTVFLAKWGIKVCRMLFRTSKLGKSACACRGVRRQVRRFKLPSSRKKTTRYLPRDLCCGHGMRQRVASGGVAAPFTLRRTLKHNDVGSGMENECVFLTQYVILHEMYVGSVAQSCQSGNPYEIKRPHAPESSAAATGEGVSPTDQARADACGQN